VIGPSGSHPAKKTQSSHAIRSVRLAALIAYCRTELTGYKVPRHVYFRTELPKTNVGKIVAARAARRVEASLLTAPLPIPNKITAISISHLSVT